MIIKILNSASKDFHGVKYNDNKINAEKGELTLMKNFPSFINEESSQEEIRNYFKSISNSERIQKPQFHAVISTKFQEHSKEELTKIGDEFMQEMGYENQPYIIVFHKDTENNHIHIVSSRVDKTTGKKINDSFEKLKSQRVLQSILEKNVSKEIDKLLNYKFSNFQQLEKLFVRSGFKIITDEKNSNLIKILKNGINQKEFLLNEIKYNQDFHKDKRSKQLKAILEKYKTIYSNKVFKVEDNRHSQGKYQKANAEKKQETKIEFESELQKKLRDIFGVDIVFHFKDDKMPFGYTLIDHSTQKVYKGSDILKMNDLFEFTQSSIDKKTFESLKDYNFKSDAEKKVLLEHLNKNNLQVEEFMLFENTQYKSKIFNQTKQDTNQTIQDDKDNEFIHFEKNENNEDFLIHKRYHQVHKVEYILDENTLQTFKNKQKQNNLFEEIFDEVLKSAYTKKDTTEEEFKRKRKKKR